MFTGYLLAGPILLSNLERQLAKVYTEERPFALRLPDAGYSHVRESNSRIRSQALTRVLAGLLAAQRLIHNESRVQRLLGRVALLNGNYDEAAVRYLRTMELDWRNPGAGLELAGALLVRAQRERRPLDFATALEYMGKAHRFAPATTIDSYNLALLYESIPAPHLAREEWARCMRLEQVAEWRAEEKAHWDGLNRLLEDRAARIRALTAGPVSFLRESERRSYAPEIALDEAISVWLPRQYEDPSARQALIYLAGQFQTQHADPWLFDLMRTPDVPSGRRAFEMLGKSCSRNREGQHEEAAPAAATAQELFRRSGNRAGELRARLEIVIAAHRTEDSRGCLQRAQSLVKDLQATPYSWLKAYAWLEETTCRSIAGDSGRLTREREDALQWISQTRYQGLELRARGFLVQPELVRANPLRLWRIVHDGLEQFWAGEMSATRAQQLYIATALTGRDGAFPLASVAMGREGVRVMEETGNLQWQALVRSVLGSIELAAGLDDAAAATFRDAEAIFARCRQNETVRRYRLEAEISRAEAEISGSAAAAVSRLTPLRQEFSVLGDTQEMMPFEQVLGLAYLRLGRFDAAYACFGRVAGRTQASLAKVDEQGQRDGILKTAEESYRGQIYIKLVRDHDAAGAFELWRRFREQRTGGRTTAGDPFPDHVSLLAIVSLPGGAAVFASDRDGVEARWIPAGGERLDDLARAFAELCSSPFSPQTEIDRVGRAIYNSVILPFEGRLLGKRVLEISAEGASASVPWSALRDLKGRRLMERQTVVMVGSLSFPEAKDTPLQTSRPLVIAAPALAPELASAYPPLGNSLREANEISRRFPGSRVLTGSAANIKNLQEFLPQSTFFHFGGHGTVNGGYGAILLAPGESSDGLFDAAQIGRLDLRRVRVVSLASCSSGAGQMGGPVNPESLVRALLDAGVRNVIASPWRVDSETTSVLFGDFYDRLASDGNAAESLRQACLRMSRRPDAAHPFFWAGFQTYGAPDL